MTYAREQVPEPTAPNIVMPAGTHTEDELIAQLEHGVYLQRFWYTRLMDRNTGTSAPPKDDPNAAEAEGGPGTTTARSRPQPGPAGGFPLCRPEGGGEGRP